MQQIITKVSFTCIVSCKDGSFEDADKVIHTEPTGPHENQNNAHVHYTDLTPDQRFSRSASRTDECVYV